jgi:cysteine-rich repeat protein
MCNALDFSTCTLCGDGVKEGTEACDDADRQSGDGCSATCTVESGFTCTGSTPSVCTGCNMDSQCTSTQYCVLGTPGVCTTKKATGVPCTANNECANGTCTGGTTCN